MNNNPGRFSDRSGGVSRCRVILPFPDAIPASERGPLLQAQQTSGEALEIKRHADPLVDFCGYLMPLIQPTGLLMGNANIRPLNPKRYLYHA